MKAIAIVVNSDSGCYFLGHNLIHLAQCSCDEDNRQDEDGQADQ